jgi:isopenicillin N synthase-like dioxygenase
MTFTEIPTIDLALAKDPTTRWRVLGDLRHALTEVGFLYISNHSVPERIIDRLIQALPILFELPREAKAEIALENSPHFLGYSGTGDESTGGKPDYREQVEFATELTDEWHEGDPLYGRLRGPNQVKISLFISSCGSYLQPSAGHSGRRPLQSYDRLLQTTWSP